SLMDTYEPLKKSELDLIDDEKWPLHPPDFAKMSRATDASIDILRRIDAAYKSADMAIHQDDEMWNGFLLNLLPEQQPYVRLHYTYGGRSAMRNIGSALVSARVPAP